MPDAIDRPFCIINGEPAAAEQLLTVAIHNFGHITMMQMRAGMVRGLEHHVARLEQANRELFGRGIDRSRLLEGLRIAAAERPNSTVRVNVFAGTSSENIMVTATAPVEPEWQPARFSLVRYERDMPHLKHVGSFGLLLRQQQAVSAGYDGAVFVDGHGGVSEATIWNIGFFDRDSVVWPASKSLRGVTQAIIEDGLRAAGIDVRHEFVHASRLERFGAAFLSNSATYGRPLEAIGDTRFATPVAMTEIIRSAYERTPYAPIPSV